MSMEQTISQPTTAITSLTKASILRISPHLQEILKRIGNNPITAVVAPTGSGKSLGIPLTVAQAGARIFVSVPTITAALSLAKHLAYIAPEISIGYAAEGDVHYNQSTQVVYATSGHLRRKMLGFFSQGKCSGITFTDVLMLDEIHIGSIDNQIILALWKHCGLQQVQIPRLVLSSAVYDPDKLLNASIYTIEIETYPIEIRYHPKSYDPEESSLLTDTAAVIKNYHSSSVAGHFLIFVSGSSEVETLINLLGNLAGAMILPAYSNLSREDVSKIYQKTGANTRKIIIATNIAETSITVPDVGLVVDTLTEKRAETSITGGFRLALRNISKASALQRCGRTGRTMPGICYRMTTKDFFDRLEESRPDEILRVPLYNTIIELLNVGLDPLTVLPNIPGSRLQETLTLLRQLNMITESRPVAGPNATYAERATIANMPGKTVVTEIGRFAPSFPLGVRNSAILWNWIKQGIPLFPGIVVVSLIDSYGPGYLWYPRREENQSTSEYNAILDEHRSRYFSKFIGDSDPATFVNIWNDLMKGVGGYDRLNSSNLLSWSTTNSINHKKIREAVNIIKQCMSSANRLGYEVKIGPFTTKGVIDKLRPLAMDAYQDLIFDIFPGPRLGYYDPKTRTVYKLDTRQALNKLQAVKPPRIIGMITAEIQTARSPVHIISVALDLDIVPEQMGIITTNTYYPNPSGIGPAPSRTRTAPATPLTSEQETRLARALAALQTVRRG